MPGVTQEQIAAARRMSAIEFLQKYRPNSLVKSSARGEYQLAEHDSFKINAKSSLWHWKSRDIGGKSALNYLIYVEGVPFVEAVRLLCEESPGYVPTPHEQVERKRPSFRLPPIAENCDRITRYLLGRGISNAVIQYCPPSGTVLREKFCTKVQNTTTVSFWEKTRRVCRNMRRCAVSMTTESRSSGRRPAAIRHTDFVSRRAKTAVRWLCSRRPLTRWRR